MTLARRSAVPVTLDLKLGSRPGEHLEAPPAAKCRHMTTIRSPAQLVLLTCARRRAQAKPQDEARID
jgi:hypothetical protein